MQGLRPNTFDQIKEGQFQIQYEAATGFEGDAHGEYLNIYFTSKPNQAIVLPNTSRKWTITKTKTDSGASAYTIETSDPDRGDLVYLKPDFKLLPFDSIVIGAAMTTRDPTLWTITPTRKQRTGEVLFTIDAVSNDHPAAFL
jgi:hypothetical protein